MRSVYQDKVLQNGATATGNGTAIEVTGLTDGPLTTLAMQVTGITTATITWEATVDGTNYVAVPFTNDNTGVSATTATANGIYRATVSGWYKVRARISAYTSGTIYVTAILSPAPLGASGGSSGSATLTEQQTQTTSLQLLDDAIATAGSAITTKGNAVAGTDGTNARILKTDSSGELQVDVLSITAGETLIGLVGASDTVIDVTFSLDTSAYAVDDVLADTQSMASVGRVNAGNVTLQSVTLIDEDDQKQPLTIVFLDANNSLGTENSAPNISDANARAILGFVRVSVSDYIDLGGVSIANVKGIGLQMQLGAGVTTLYVGLISGGTGTYTASGLRGKFAFLRS